MGDEEKAMYFAIAEKEKLKDPQPKKDGKGIASDQGGKAEV